MRLTLFINTRVTANIKLVSDVAEAKEAGEFARILVEHVSTHRPADRQVLIMDVNRAWYVPYRTTDSKLLEAMLSPALAGKSPRRRDRRSRLD